MSKLRRLLPSGNCLFFFEAVARTGSFTSAAAELNVTQPAVSRMLGRFEEHLGVRLFERRASGVKLTDEGQLLYGPIATAFGRIEAGLSEIERRRSGLEAVTLSVSSAFTTHWLMPRLDRLKRTFPKVDLRFQLIAGPLHGPVDNVDLGMRFTEGQGPTDPAGYVMREVMLPVCAPAYMGGPEAMRESPTVIHLANGSTDWVGEYDNFGNRDGDGPNALTFSDYAVVLQAALLGQGVALGWLTVISHWLIVGALVPAVSRPTITRRHCELLHRRDGPVRPVVLEVRDWILEDMRSDLMAVDSRFPELRLLELAYGPRAGVAERNGNQSKLGAASRAEAVGGRMVGFTPRATATRAHPRESA